MTDYEKRKKIIKNYRNNLKQSVIAPMDKNPLNIGNPLNSEEIDKEMTVAKIDLNSLQDLRYKRLEQKINKIYIYSIAAFICSAVALLLVISKL